MSRSTSRSCARSKSSSIVRPGNQVFYSVRDPIIVKVLDLMRTYFQAHLKEALAMLGEMEKPREKAR